MRTISLKPNAASDGTVCRCQTALFGELPLGSAILIAGEMARTRVVPYVWDASDMMLAC